MEGNLFVRHMTSNSAQYHILHSTFTESNLIFVICERILIYKTNKTNTAAN